MDALLPRGLGPVSAPAELHIPTRVVVVPARVAGGSSALESTGFGSLDSFINIRTGDLSKEFPRNLSLLIFMLPLRLGFLFDDELEGLATSSTVTLVPTTTVTSIPIAATFCLLGHS